MRKILLLFLVCCCTLTAISKTPRQAPPAPLRNAFTDVSFALEGRAQWVAATAPSVQISLAEAPQLYRPSLSNSGRPEGRSTGKFVTGIVLTSLGGVALIVAAASFIIAGAVHSGGTVEDTALFDAIGVVFLLAAAGLSIPGILLLSKYAPRRGRE